MVYGPVSAGASLVLAGEVQFCACRCQISGLVPVVGLAEKRNCLFPVVPLLRIAVSFQRKADIWIAGRSLIVNVLDLVGLESHCLRVQNEAIIVSPVYLVEQLHRCNHITNGSLVHVIEHGKVTLAINRFQDATHRCIVSVILKAKIVFIGSHSFEEFSHLVSGDGGFRCGDRCGDVQIECLCISVLFGVGLAVREIEASAVQVGITGFLPVKHREIPSSPTVHDLELPITINNFTVLEILPLLLRQFPSLAVSFQGILSIDTAGVLCYSISRKLATI